MKNFYKYKLSVLIAGLLFITSNLFAQDKTATLPFTEDFSDATRFENLWTVVDNNGDTKTWAIESSSKRVKCSWTSSKSEMDDYLISPLFTLIQGKTYTLTFDLAANSSSFAERMKVVLGTGTTVADFDLSSSLSDYYDFKNKDYTSKTVEISVPTTGQYAFCFYVYSPKNRDGVLIKDISLNENVNLPGAVTDFAINAGSENEMKAMLSWTNPTTNTTGGSLEAEELTKIEIYRNGTLAQTITEGLTPGAAISWNEILSTNGNYTYQIIPYNGTNAGTPAQTSRWFGGGLELPYGNSLETQADFDGMIVLDNNNDGKTWKWNTGKYAAIDNSLSSLSADDYLITPPLKLKAGSNYKLSYEYQKNGTWRYSEKMKVKVGNGSSANDFIIELKDYSTIDNTSFTGDEITFSVDENADYYISFQCYSDSYQSNLCIRNIKIEELVSLPGFVTEATITPDVNKEMKAEISWKNPTLSSTGTELSQADLTKIQIYRNDETEPVAELNNPTIGESMTWTDKNVPQTGINKYTVIPCNGNYKGESTTISAWIGGGLLLPYNITFTKEEFNILNIIDANNDTRTWKWRSGNGAEYTSTAKPDDWIMSAPLELTRRKVYKIDFTYKTESFSSLNHKNQHIKVMATQNLTIDENVIEIGDYPDISFSGFELSGSNYFIPEESGVYYIGFWLCSEESSDMSIRKLDITEESVIFPDIVTNVKITPSDYNPLHHILTWNNPDNNSVGSSLQKEELTKIEIYRDDLELPIYSIENPVVGAELTWTDNSELTDGLHYYHFIACNGEFSGEKLSITVWAGSGMTLPYQNEVSTEEKFNELIVLNNNRDDKTWTWNSNGYAQYTYSFDNAADDYLMTPAMEMNANSLYKISFNYAGTSENKEEKLEVLLGTGYTAGTQTIQLIDYPSIHMPDRFYMSQKHFTVPQDGKYIISFRCYSDANNLGLKIKDIQVEEIPIQPEKVADLSVTPDTNKALKATINWTNPALNQIGESLDESQLTRIDVYRNNVIVHSVSSGLTPGESSNWEDENVPAKGKYTYKLIPYNDTNAGPADSVTVWVGDGLELPYENTLATVENFDELIVIDAGGENTWTWNSAGYAEYINHMWDAGDDYLITSPLKLKAGIRYKIKFDYSKDGNISNLVEKLKVLIGKSTDPTELSATVMKDYTEINNKDFTTDEIYYKVDEDGDYYIAFYCYSDRNQTRLKIKNISVEETITLPGKVTNASVMAGDNKELTATLSWINPSIDAFDEILHPVNFDNVKIYRNNETEPLATLTNPEIGEPQTWKDENVPANGLYLYSIVPCNGEHQGEAVTVKTWVGRGADIPYSNSLATAEETEELTILDNNVDGITWKFDLNEGWAVYDVRGQETGDDYLFSAPLYLEKGLTYKITFGYASYNGLRTDKMKVMLGKEKTADNQIILKDYPEIQSSSFHTDNVIFSVNETGDYYISFHAYSGPDGWHVRVKELEITETYTTPNPVSDVTVIPAEDKSLKATIRWKNPITNTTNTDLLPDNLTKIDIYRDNEQTPVHSVTNPVVGADESWTDENVPTNGNHTYRIVPSNNEYEGEAVSATAWIGGGLLLPYTNNLTESEFNDLTIINANDDYLPESENPRTWKWKENSVAYEYYTAPDDWFITPALELEKEKQYQVEIMYSTGGGSLYFNEQRIKITIGDNADTSSQTTEIGDFTGIEFSSLSQRLNTTFSVDEDDTYYIGFHLCSEEGEYIYVHSINVKEIYLDITSDKEYWKNEADYARETVRINSNIQWEATTTDSWINLSENPNGSNNGTFTFQCDANSGNMRTGTILIESDHLSQTVTIHQAGAPVSNLKAEKTGDELRDVELTWVSPDYDGVKFNVYRDGEIIANEITESYYKEFELQIREDEYCYAVSVLYPNGTETTHSVSVCVKIEKKVGVDNILNDNQIFISNPVVNQLYMESDIQINKMEIFHIDGKRMQSVTVNSTQLTLDVSSWNKGAYLIRVETEAGVNKYKIIKQ